MFKKIVIIGAGLIGGSLALAIRENELAEKLFAVAIDQKRADAIAKTGIFDEISLNAIEAVKDADLIVLAVPISSYAPIIDEILSFVKEGAIITDVGSVKSHFVKLGAFSYRPDVAFVAAHPIAGSEKSGIENANGELFDGAKLITCNESANHLMQTQKVQKLWREIGCEIMEMPSQTHDMIYAVVSHLPQLLAFVQSHFEDLGDDKGFLQKHKRLRGSNTELWSDILVYNNQKLIEALSVFEIQLIRFKVILERASNSYFEQNMAVAHFLHKSAVVIDEDYPVPLKILPKSKDFAIASLMAASMILMVEDIEKDLDLHLPNYFGRGFIDYSSPLMVDHEVATKAILQNKDYCLKRLDAFLRVLDKARYLIDCMILPRLQAFLDGEDIKNAA